MEPIGNPDAAPTLGSLATFGILKAAMVAMLAVPGSFGVRRCNLGVLAEKAALVMLPSCRDAMAT